MNRIRYCEKCKTYTLKDTCSKCGSQTVLRVPLKYSNDEQIKKYRRELSRDSP